MCCIAEDTLSFGTQTRIPVARQAELCSRVGIVYNLSYCLSQIQHEAAAPPDGIPHVSRKTQKVACFDRQGNSFSPSRLLFWFFPSLLCNLLCLFWMAVLLITGINYTCKASLYMCICLSMSLYFFVCISQFLLVWMYVFLNFDVSLWMTKSGRRERTLSQGSRGWEKAHKPDQGPGRRLEANG